MAGRSLVSVLVMCALAGPAGAQVPERLVSAIADARRAATVYVAGDTDAALRLLDAHPPGRQRDVVDRVLKLARLRPLELTDETEPWTHEAVAAFATLHMEAALRAYAARDAASQARARQHVAMAEPMFAFAASWPLRKSAARRWELALGLTALADGELGWAASFLDPACRAFPDDVPLLIACATSQETHAVLAATAPFVRISDEALRRLRAKRADLLNTAEKQLERAMRAEPDNLEARLRLAHVRAMKGEDRDAARLLEEIEFGKLAADARTRYLALLFLGQIRQRAGHAEAAVALFRQATTVAPRAPAALLALAQAAHAQGRTAEAAELATQALSTSRPVADPWWSYRFGQYWLRELLLASLRAEVRK